MTNNLGAGAIVGWLRAHDTDSDLAGCAFLLGPDIALTCAHVVGAHLGFAEPISQNPPSEEVTVRFEFLQAEMTGRVLPGGWFSNARPRPGELSDIAVIRLDKPVLAISPFPAIAQRMPNQSQPVLIHGAEADYKSYGQQVSGKMSGSNIARGWRQIDPADSTRGFTVGKGFSGSPVLDGIGNVIWGMIVAVATGGSGVAYAIPSEDIWAALKSAGVDTAIRLSQAHDEWAAATMSKVLENIRMDEFSAGRDRLRELENRLVELSESYRARTFYNRACLESAYAEELASRDVKRRPALDEALRYLTRWLKVGLEGGWASEGKTAHNEVHRMGSDSDLRCLLEKKRELILENLPEIYRSSLPSKLPKRRGGEGGGGGVGCIPGNAFVSSPLGPIAAASLRQGDQIISVQLDREASPLTTRISQVHTSRAAECILLNESFLFTASQPLYLPDGKLILACDVEVGMQLLGNAPTPIDVRSKRIVSGYFEVFNMTTDHPTHNYIAYESVVCHNDKM